MARYMIHLENNGYKHRDAKGLLKKAKELADGIDAIVRDARVASKHVEFDVGIDKDKIDSLLDKLSKIARVKRCVEIDERELSKEEAMHYAKELFNDERYWECHEVLEGVWKESKGKEKEVIQGIILVAAALVHMQKEEYDIGFAILKRAIPKLEHMDTLNPFNVKYIKDNAKDMVDNKIVRFFKI